MCPRSYQLGKRQDQIAENRLRVIDAARALLSEASSYSSFTVDAVARRADVARATVYYQFESKIGVLEALCDALAEAGQMSELAAAFMNPDPVEAISAFIACFGRFWDVDRLVMRRLRSLAVLEAEVGAVISARDDRRRAGITVLVERLRTNDLLSCEPDQAIRTLFSLTSFETFDALAMTTEALMNVVEWIRTLASVVWKE